MPRGYSTPTFSGIVGGSGAEAGFGALGLLVKFVFGPSSVSIPVKDGQGGGRVPEGTRSHPPGEATGRELTRSGVWEGSGFLHVPTSAGPHCAVRGTETCSA